MSGKQKAIMAVIWVLMAFLAILTIFPVVYIILGSFKSNVELLVGGSNIFPSEWHPENYVQAWTGAKFATYTWNSVTISVCVMLISLFISTMAGYVFSRSHFPGKNLIYGIFVAFMFITVGSVSIRPLYELATALHLNESLLPIVLISVGTGQATYIFLSRGFVDSVPKELDEAAKIDGCTNIQTIIHISVPLMVSSFVQCLFLTLTRCFMVYDVNLSLTKGEPFGSSVMAAMHVYNQAFTYKNFGTGQAEALVLFVVCAVVGVLQVYIGKKAEVSA